MKHRNRTSPGPVIRLLGVLAILGMLGGCSSAKFIPTGSIYPARADDCQIEVFSSKVPERGYEELGIIEGEGSLGADTLAKVLPKMKQEACRAGGDALIMGHSGKSVGVSGGDDWIGSDDKLNVTATVIKWTE